MLKTGFNWNFGICPRFLADVNGHGRCDIGGFGIDGVWVARSDGMGGLTSERVSEGFAYNKGSWRVDQHVRLVAEVKGRQSLVTKGTPAAAVGHAASSTTAARRAGSPGAPIGSHLGASIGVKHPPVDLVGFGDGGVWVALNNGDGSFGAIQFALANFGVSQSWLVDRDVRLLADLTGEGRDSIVGFGEEGVWIALNDGRGGFDTNLQFFPGFGFTQGWRLHDHPRFAADLNATGSADLVGFGEEAVWVAFNDGHGGFTPPGQRVLNDMCFSRGWGAEHPRFAARLTKSGRADLVGFGPDDVWVARNNGDNSFGLGQLAQRTMVNNFCYNQGWRVGRHPRFVADLTGKGHADLVGFFDDDVHVALNNGDGEFGPAHPTNINNLCYNQGWRVGWHPRFLADMTGDGLPDIVGFGDDGVWVARNNGDGTFGPANFVLNDFGLRSLKGIKHIFVLMMENRSFDHMLGLSGITGTDPETGQSTPIEGVTAGRESNSLNPNRICSAPPGRAFAVEAGAPDTMPVDPGHDFLDVLIQLAGPEAGGAWQNSPGQYPPSDKRCDNTKIVIDNSGFVARYRDKVGQAKEDPGLIMKCFGPGELPVLQQLAKEFVVCDHWYSSIPGATWPNRFFAHAASSGGLDTDPDYQDIFAWEKLPNTGFSFQNGTIFDALSKSGLQYKVYSADEYPVASALYVISNTFDVGSMENMRDEIGGQDFANAFYVHIEPYYNFGDFAAGNSQHPIGSVSIGESFIKEVYEIIRNSPVWESSILILTWDEHGGFYDHVAPPVAHPPGDPPKDPSKNKFGFRFDRYGARVPAIIISPWIPKNIIDHRIYDHASIPATIERLTGIEPLTDRDRYAESVTTLLTLMAPRQDTPTTLVPSLEPLRVTQPFTAPAASINEGDVAAFLSTAVVQDLKVSTPEARAAIFRRIREIKTHGDAWAYMKDVEKKITARRVCERSKKH